MWQLGPMWSGGGSLAHGGIDGGHRCEATGAHGSVRCVGLLVGVATCGRECFQVQWAGLICTQEYGIMAKEMLPIVAAAAVWGQKLAGSLVLARCRWWQQSIQDHAGRRMPCI